MKAMNAWYGTKVMFIIFILFFGFASIHFALAVWYNTPVSGWETLGRVSVWGGLIFSIFIVFIFIPFMYHLHINLDNKYIEEINIPLFKFKIHDFNNFIVISYYNEYHWVLKKITNGYDLKENNCIPFRNYYNRNGNFSYAIPSIRYIK